MEYPPGMGRRLVAKRSPFFPRANVLRCRSSRRGNVAGSLTTHPRHRALCDQPGTDDVARPRPGLPLGVVHRADAVAGAP